MASMYMHVNHATYSLMLEFFNVSEDSKKVKSVYEPVVHQAGAWETMWSKVSCLRKQHDGRDQARTIELTVFW